MHNTGWHLQRSNLGWLHLDRFNHLRARLSGQEATDGDLSITYSEGVTPYDYSTDLDTNLDLGVRKYSIVVGTGGGNAEQRGHRKQGTTGILAQRIPLWLMSLPGWR
jgi:hypothetical protein